MKLFFQVVAFIAVVVALVWAKKNLFDAPKQEESVVAISAPKPKPLTLGNDGMIVAQPQPRTAIQMPADPQTTTGKDEDNAIANLLHRFVGGAKPEDRARVRMKGFMQAWKMGGTSLNDAEQAASCMYSRGKLFIPNSDEIREAYNGFVGFRKEKNLYTTITDYSIAETSSRAQDQQHGDYTIFDVTINGFPYTIGVPDKPNPIFWIR